MKKRRMEFYIGKDQHDALLALANKTGDSIAELIRKSIDKFLQERRNSKEQEDDISSKRT